MKHHQDKSKIKYTITYMKKILFGAALSMAAMPAMAHTDLLNENFDGDWTVSFTTLELDHAAPHTSINAAFTDSQGVACPWWIGKDDRADTDRFFISHSYYQQPSQSNDWAVSNAMTVPSEGFTLSFDAQSVPIRSGETHALSDLWVFVTEQPVTASWQPAASDAAHHIEAISYGKDRDNCKGDYQHYEFSLDAYKGKTVYISFANLNTDKDILAIDNVLVRRPDKAEISATAPDYIVHGDFNVEATIKGTSDEGLDNWTVTFVCGDVKKTESGTRLANGQEERFTFTAAVGADQTADYTVTLSSAGVPDIVASGSTTGLSFQTTRRILVEETTGVWCGNCPTAIYTMECLEKEEEYEGRILPVSVHVGNDPMVVEEYEYMFGIGAVAPFFRVDRDFTLIGTGDNDFKYDPTNEKSAAYSILRYLDRETIADIEVKGSYLKNGNKITGVDVTAEFTPAITMEGSRYRIGFILTENNVNRGNAPRSIWAQHNYLSGAAAVDKSIPFYYLPESIANMYFQDVARQIYGFRGEENTVPAQTLPVGEKVSYNTQLGLPDPTVTSPDGTVTVPGLDTRNLYITAFLIDGETNTVVNSARVALSEEAEAKKTSADVLAATSVESIETESGEAEYFNMQGIRVLDPVPGIYVVRRGDKVTKEVVR